MRTRRDPEILERAAKDARLLLTHDADTMIEFVKLRVIAGIAKPGIIEIAQDVPIGKAIDELVIFASCSVDGEWEGQVIFLPL